MLRSTKNTYGLIAKALHWSTALIILGLLSLGFYMDGLAFSPFKLALYGWHKSFGILVLMLLALRVIWRFTNAHLLALPSHQAWERVLAKLIHILLYAAMIGMPLSGWIMSSAAEFPVPFFGLFDLPALTGKDEALFKLMKEVHEVSAFVIIGIVGLHVAGALKHHFIDGDETLQRMTSRLVGFWRGGLLAVVVGLLLTAPLTFIYLDYVKLNKKETSINSRIGGENVLDREAGFTGVQEVVRSEHEWLINDEQSTIAFEVIQHGQVFSGEFEVFTGTIMFDVDDLASSYADITIDIASIKTGSDDRDEQARSDEWFDALAFPQARFTTQNFRHIEANRYEVDADLTIRGMTLPIILPFTLDISKTADGAHIAKMKGNLMLERLAWRVGQGQWESTEYIGNQVILTITLQAFQ